MTNIFVLPLSMRGPHAWDRQWFHGIRPFSVWVTTAAVSFRTLPSGAPTVLSERVCTRVHVHVFVHACALSVLVHQPSGLLIMTLMICQQMTYV